jgi:RNA polymerase sigma factor (sigma-70 family)
MQDPSLHSAQLQEWLRRYRAGDLAARDEMLLSIGGRLQALARKMLRRFSNVRRWVDTDDVLQNALLRLLRHLQQIEPDSVLAFYTLAAAHLRRELIDLARYHARRERAGLYPSTRQAAEDEAPEWEPTDRGEDPDELDRWCRFHEEVEKLSAEEREVVSLIFYHGWKQTEVADLFGISERTVRRRWDAAKEKLGQILKPPRP